MKRVADVARPARIFDAGASLEQASPALLAEGYALFRTAEHIDVLLAEDTIGFPSSRRLDDLGPARAIRLVPEMSVSDALSLLDAEGAQAGYLLLEDEDDAAAIVLKQDLLEQVLSDAQRSQRLGLYLTEALRAGRSLVWSLPLLAGSEGGGDGEVSPDLAALEIHGPVEEILGYAVDDLRGMGALWLDLLHPDDREQIARFSSHLARNETLWESTVRLRHGRGGWIWMQAVVRQQPSSSGTQALLHGFLTDISVGVQRIQDEDAISKVHEVIAGEDAEAGLPGALDILAEKLEVEHIRLLSRASERVPWQESVVLRSGDGRNGDRPPSRIASDDGPYPLATSCGECAERACDTGDPALMEGEPEEWDARCGEVRSCLVRPLLMRREMQAALLLQDRRPGVLGERALGLVSRVAPALLAAFSAREYQRDLQQLNASLDERVRRRTFELEVLHGMSQRLSTALNYDDLFAEMVVGLHPVLQHDLAITLLYFDDVKELISYPVVPVSDELLSSIQHRVCERYGEISGVIPVVARMSHHGRQDEWQAKVRCEAPLERVRSEIHVPLIVGSDQQTIGLLWLCSGQPDAFSEDHLRLLRSVVRQASVSVERLRALVAAERHRLEQVLEHIPSGVLLVDLDSADVLIHNSRASQQLASLSSWRPGGQIERLGGYELEDLVERAVASPVEITSGSGGSLRVLLVQAAAVSDGVAAGRQYVLTLQDVTREREIEQQARTQERLVTVGQLAGGVAHDFNNLLTVILASVGFLREDLHGEEALAEDLDQIQAAADRAVSLTRQLLAFSRRQLLQPEVIDLNQLVLNVEKMLRRLIGEDIRLMTCLASDLSSVKADPGQIEQVVVNLAVNARDAMPDGGTLLIETSLVTLDDAYAAERPGVAPGRYVMLAVSDTGVGMDADVRRRAFEPFFSTKDRSRSTGLGLATVYGIVKQSGGNIWLYSEPGEGTTFKVYLPALDLPASSWGLPRPQDAEAVRIVDDITVLVVEDSDAVRRMTSRILARAGYSVLEASDGLEALTVADGHDGTIHLLLTDVVMPGPSGRKTAELLLERRPRMKVVYMSGYTDNAIVHHGVLDADVFFIQKPFSAHDLYEALRRALEAELG